MKVNTFTLLIDNFDNSAMADDSSGEVSRMLRSVADSIENYGVPHQDGSRLIDSNGNQVGEVAVDWDEDVDTSGADTIDGTYGSDRTPCHVFTYHRWYAVEGSRNVNRTYDELSDGVDVETLDDDDMFTAGEPINSEEDLVEACKE